MKTPGLQGGSGVRRAARALLRQLGRRRTGGQPKRTLLTAGEVSEALGAPLPSTLTDSAGFSCVALSRQLLRPGGLCCVPADARVSVNSLLGSGAVAFVSQRPVVGAKGEVLPTFVCPDPDAAFVDLMRHLRTRHSPKVALITGSIGKTTVKEMARLACSAQFKTAYSPRNSNGPVHAAGLVQRLKPTTEVLIQELGAARPGRVERASRILEPDAFVVTNIGFNHVGDYGGDHAALVADKLSPDQHLAPGGVALLNRDDPTLRELQLTHPIIWFSAQDPAANFYARGVETADGSMCFDIVEARTGVSTPVRLRTQGEHNVVNAVAAFALARQFGVSAENAARGLGLYRGKGTRQNLIEAGGIRVLVDCFNSSEDAIASTSEVLDSLQPVTDHRRILVLGDIDYKLGDLAEQIHRRVGKALAVRSRADVIALYGPHMGWAAEELRAAGRQAFHTEDRGELHRFLRGTVGPGDVVALKAGQQMALSLSVDALFGTDFLHEDGYELGRRSKELVTPSGTYRVVDGYGAVFWRLSPLFSGRHLKIYEEAGGEPVLMVARRACKANALRAVVVPVPVRTLGREAFAGSRRLKRVGLPESLRLIGESAFSDCVRLKEVRVPEGCETIQDRAFRGCTHLKQVWLPASLRTLGPGVFDGCPRLTVRVPAGSVVLAQLRTEFPNVGVVVGRS